MTDAELLGKVKNALGVSGTYQDATLNIYISEVKEYLKDAGVDDSIVDGEAAVGVICRGVSDLWNYGAGNAQLSIYFMQRASQLALKEPTPTPSVVTIESATVNVDGEGLPKNGYIIMTDGTVVPISVDSIPKLTVTATKTTIENPYTTVTVTPPLTDGNKYMYSMRGSIPAYGEPITNYNYFEEWDGVSQINTEGQNYLTIVECDSNDISVKAGKCYVDMDF